MMGAGNRFFRVGLLLVVTLLLAACCGVIYNELSIRHFRHVAGTPGRLYDVGGYEMHLYCTGHGSPTIVLDSGLGDDFTVWALVQPALSQVTEVCSYDRAGFGWSQSRSGVQDANAISSQLHQLLSVAGVHRPIILMGHSIAGLYLRAYAARFPDDVDGLVFVDGATPLQDDRVPRELVRIENVQRREMPWQKLLMTIGWYRLQGACTTIPSGFESYGAWIRADSCIPSQMDAIEGELDAERASGMETLHAHPAPGLPILIFSRDPDALEPGWPPSVSIANAMVWNQMQEEEKDLSTQSLRIIAKGSHHPIQVERPDLINREVTAFVEQIRGNHPFPVHHATTEE